MKMKEILGGGEKKMLVPVAIAGIVIILLALFFTGFFEPKIPAKELGIVFESMDAGAGLSEISVMQFERIKDMNIESLSPKEVLNLMQENLDIYEFEEAEAVGATGGTNNQTNNLHLDIMAMKFNDNFSAEKYFVALETKLAKEYKSAERLNYEEISAIFESKYGETVSERMLLKKGSFLIIMNYDKW